MSLKRSRTSKWKVATAIAKIRERTDPARLAPVEPRSRVVILVAEDDVVNQKVALLHLKDLGLAADLVSNGEEAVAACLKQRYALILMDCLMPVMDGVAATRIIRAQEASNGHRVPIIAMSAHVVEGAREECLSAGMDDFISKPFAPGKLEKVLTRWLSLFGQPDIDSSIGFSSLAEMIGREAATDVLRVYATSTAALLMELHKALLDEDVRGAHAALSELHGSGTVIGASLMMNMCEQLSESVGTSQWQNALLSYERLVNESRRIDNFVKELLRTA